ncbi:MAG TPA: spore coat protein YlbD [Bacillales bacterium]
MVQKSPSAKVAKFKAFVKSHPGLIDEVRGSNRSWQNVYEEWDIFGEDPEIWEPYLPQNRTKGAKGSKRQGAGSAAKQTSSKKSQLSLASLFALLEKVDFDQLQNNLTQISGALENAQKLMGQFQNKNSSQSGNSGPQGMQGGPQGPQGPPGYGPYPPQYNNNNNSNQNSPFPF